MMPSGPPRLSGRANRFLISAGEALEPTAGLISRAEIPEQKDDFSFVMFEKVTNTHQRLKKKKDFLKSTALFKCM